MIHIPKSSNVELSMKRTISPSHVGNRRIDVDLFVCDAILIITYVL
jgi:7,8-dihydro-6-hydroxymethylpterin-pyrophosphokinase